MTVPWGEARDWSPARESGARRHLADVETADGRSKLLRLVTRLQARFRGGQARKKHLPLVRSGAPWAPPVWIKPRAAHDMLKLAGAGHQDTVFDLGCGHGAVLLCAAKEFGVSRVVGVEIDPLRVRTARRRLAEAGLVGAAESSARTRCEVICGDVLSAVSRAASEATIVVCFMSPDAHERLFDALCTRCRAGTRVVFYAFSAGSKHKPLAVVDTVPHMTSVGRSKLFLYKCNGQ